MGWLDCYVDGIWAKNGWSEREPTAEERRAALAKLVDGHRFLTAIYGRVLDSTDNVSHSVDRFTFPNRAQTKKSSARRSNFSSSMTSSRQSRMSCPGIYADLYERKAAQEKDMRPGPSRGLRPSVD